MDYLEFFNLTDEPFGHAPLPKFYYASEQHTNALSRLMYAANGAKGLAVLVGDIGRGKTTLARRMLDSLPENQFEAAMLVMVHTGITPSWLLKRIAIQLGVPDPADDKLTILSQLYQRLVQIHQSGRKALVLIDEAQMLQSREIMEEFRGLLNLELPGHKLISFVFFGLPTLEHFLALDPPLAQRVALRYRLRALSEEDTVNYIQHRLQLVGGDIGIFTEDALAEVHRFSEGVPRVINTLCDNVLLELFFAQSICASSDLVVSVAENLALGADTASAGRAAQAIIEATTLTETPATDDAEGADAMVVVTPDGEDSQQGTATDTLSADDIAARIANEPPEAEPEELAVEPDADEDTEGAIDLAPAQTDVEDADEIDAEPLDEVDDAPGHGDSSDIEVHVSPDGDWGEAPVEVETGELAVQEDGGGNVELDIDTDAAQKSPDSDEDEAVLVTGAPLDADDLLEGEEEPQADIADPLSFLQVDDEEEGAAPTSLEAAFASDDVVGAGRAAAEERDELAEEETASADADDDLDVDVDLDVDLDVDVDVDVDLDEPEELESELEPVELIEETTDPDSSRGAEPDEDEEMLELVDELDEVAELDAEPAAAAQPASEPSPPVQLPKIQKPEKSERRRFTTKTGKVIDLSEIDDLLADLD